MVPRTGLDTMVTSIQAERWLGFMCIVERTGVGLLLYSRDMLHPGYIAALHAGLAIDPTVAQKP